MAKQYHGMTMQEINEKYYIHINGEESPSQLNFINSKLARIWQDINNKYVDTLDQLSECKTSLRQIEEELELHEHQVKWKHIVENKLLQFRDRLSDPGRETAAIIETRTPNLISNLKVIKNQIDDLNRELMVWKEVKENISYVSDRVKNNGMNIAIEAKLLKEDPVNIPTEDFIERKKEHTTDVPDPF